jgi:hypothetical protein
VHEPFIGEKLSNVWHIFFIEITDCTSVPEFSMHQHVEPTVMAVIGGDIKMVVLVKKRMLLKKVADIVNGGRGVMLLTYCSVLGH